MFIYKIKDDTLISIVKDYKNVNKYFKMNLTMTDEEELLFIYNIQRFLISQRQKSTFKFLNDEITVSIKNSELLDTELLVDSKLIYEHAKHYPIEKVYTLKKFFSL